MYVHADRAAGQLILTAAGVVGPAAASDLAEALEVFQAASFAQVTLDLTATTGWTQACLGMLVQANRTITAAGGQLTLSRPAGWYQRTAQGRLDRTRVVPATTTRTGASELADASNRAG